MFRKQVTQFVCMICAICCTCLAKDPATAHLFAKGVSAQSKNVYYWHSESVAGGTAQLLTLFSQCDNAQTSEPCGQDSPLLSVLRDTLGDSNPDNDRLSYVWLLSYARPTLSQQILSAIPFFYWHIGDGSKSVRNTSPLLNVTAPVHPVLSGVGHDVLQWTILDPMTRPVRASSRAYGTNQADYLRLHLEQAISYLRNAPVSDDDSALTAAQANGLIARLELRKSLLGGLVNQQRIAQIGQESGFAQEQIRSRNWELLRQCAERTGLLFQPLQLASSSDQYAILWMPLQARPASHGVRLNPVWKLLNIKDPWKDERLKDWSGRTYTLALDSEGHLVSPTEPDAHSIQAIPLAVYSLTYPKLPLLVVDFRGKLHLRGREMTQRSINELASGIIGVSHFANWYYFVGADAYDFISSRHGAATDRAERLDSYSQFRAGLALDRNLDENLRDEMQERVDSLNINPLESSPDREMQLVRERYLFMQRDETEGKLTHRLDKARRSELAAFGETPKHRVGRTLLTGLSVGLYRARVSSKEATLSALDRERRVEYDLGFLNSLVQAGTRPEVSYQASRIRNSVTDLASLLPSVQSKQIRERAVDTLEKLKQISSDENLQADCSSALAFLKEIQPVNSPAHLGIVTSTRTAEHSTEHPELP